MKKKKNSAAHVNDVTSSPSTPLGALCRRRPDLVHRRLATVSAPPPIHGLLIHRRAAKPLVGSPELHATEAERRRADVRVVREAAAVGGVEERERLAAARAGRCVVGPQAPVDDPALVPQPALHLPLRLAAPGRRRWRWRLMIGRAGRDAEGRRLGPPGGVAVVARGAEAVPPLRVEGPPPRLVREARVRLRARRDQLHS